jgi:hypothetical protein
MPSNNMSISGFIKSAGNKISFCYQTEKRLFPRLIPLMRSLLAHIEDDYKPI